MGRTKVEGRKMKRSNSRFRRLGAASRPQGRRERVAVTETRCSSVHVLACPASTSVRFPLDASFSSAPAASGLLNDCCRSLQLNHRAPKHERAGENAERRGVDAEDGRQGVRSLARMERVDLSACRWMLDGGDDREVCGSLVLGLRCDGRGSGAMEERRLEERIESDWRARCVVRQHSANTAHWRRDRRSRAEVAGTSASSRPTARPRAAWQPVSNAPPHLR